MKIVINNCYGGFTVSPFGVQKMMERKGIPVYFYKQTKYNFRDGCKEYTKMNIENDSVSIFFTTLKDYGNKIEENFYDDDLIYINGNYRTDTDLIAVLEKYGSEKVSGSCSELVIEDIPTGTAYRINEYDGLENIGYKESDNWDIAT